MSVRCIFVAFAMAGAVAAGAQEDPPVATRIEPYKILQMPTITWPGQVNREALVYVEFTLKADGTIADVKLAEGGFHEPVFTRNALQAIRKLRMEPARIDGVPVDSVGLRMPFRYSIGGENARGITADFRAELAKVDELVRSHDNAGAHFHVQWMLSEKVRLGYEYAVLHVRLAETHAAVGNTHRALEASRLVTTRITPDFTPFQLRNVPPNSARNYLLPEAVVAQLLTLRMRLAATSGLLREALWAYYELAGLTPIPADDPRAVLAERLAEVLEGDGTLIGKIEIGESGGWTHTLYRRQFTVEKSSGEITDLRLQCGDSKDILPTDAGIEWKVSGQSEDCRLSIYGTPGTTLTIIEPASAALAP